MSVRDVKSAVPKRQKGSVPDEKEIFQDGFTTKNTGSGIGLYLCKKAFEEHGGSLRLVKSDKKKTEFEIGLPLTK